MDLVSLRPLLDALNRAKRSTIEDTSQAVSIDEILVSTDFRGGLVAFDICRYGQRATFDIADLQT